MNIAYRDYAIPLFFAVAVHTIIVFLLAWNWDFEDLDRRIIRPNTIQTSLIALQRERKPLKKVIVPSIKRIPQEIHSPARSEPQKLATKKNAVAPKFDLELERRKNEEAIRNERLMEMRQLAFDQAIDDESDHLIQQAASQEVMGYVDEIYSLLVTNWSRPPSARNGMSATIRVELFPNGELNTVSLVKSSGHDVFDRSALSAVRKARKFPVPNDTSLFERQFRSFTLLFEPEDLLR